jgi:hypothetical protein
MEKKLKGMPSRTTISAPQPYLGTEILYKAGFGSHCKVGFIKINGSRNTSIGKLGLRKVREEKRGEKKMERHGFLGGGSL